MGLRVVTGVVCAWSLGSLAGCPGKTPSALEEGAGAGSTVAGPGGNGVGQGGQAGQGGAGGDGGGGAPNVCGDGDRSAAEICDDGNDDPGDGCDESCEPEEGWDCDGSSPTACEEVCGDGLEVGDETCDDENTEGGDGCSAECLEERCGDGVVVPGQLCFHAPVILTGGVTATPVDFDNDGMLDLLIAGHSGVGDQPMAVRLATAPGVFGDPEPLAIAGLQAVAGRMNDDDFLDIVVTTGGEARTLLNDGSGGFGSPLTAQYLGVAFMRVALGKLNGDDVDDLATTGCDDASGCGNGPSNSKTHLNAGAGTFLAATATVPGRVSNFTIVAKLDGDQHNDVLALNYSGNALGFFKGNGAGGLAAEVTSAIPDNCFLNHMDVADVNGDGDLDVVVGSQCLLKPIYVLLGNGDGTFGDPVTLATNANTFAARFLDVDNDGHEDVLAGTQAVGGKILLYRGHGDGTFDAVETLFTVTDGDLHPSGADLNGDGAMDIVTTHSSGLAVYLSDP